MDISWILRQIVDKTWARTYLGHIMDICRTYTGQGQKLDKLRDTYIDMEHHNLTRVYLACLVYLSKGLIGKRLREYHVVKEAFTQSPQNGSLNNVFKICLFMAKDQMHTIYCHFMPLLGSQLRATPGYVSIRLPSVRALRLHQHILQGKPVLNLA